jgi:hypothetical protein
MQGRCPSVPSRFRPAPHGQIPGTILHVDRITRLQKRILETVANHYWKSHDFNGILIDDLYKAEPAARLEDLKKLILRGSLDLISSEHEVNAHIKRMHPRPREAQIGYLSSATANQVCAYPSPMYASRTLGPRSDLKRPFTKLLQLAHPQLEPHFFSLAVLDRYNMDPRYRFDFAGLDGHISTTERHYRSRQFPRRDKVLLRSFGLGRNARGTRIVAVFLRYLHDLSAEHQRYWESYLEKGKCTIEANYLRRSWFGEWTEGMPIYAALLKEMSHINGIWAL